MWIKESLSLWPYDILCLSAHAIGMALLVGFSMAIALRVLGYAPRVPLAPFAQFFPVVYVGFWINALSGTGLFITYPVKAVTNPIFYAKMMGVIAALVCIRRIKREVWARGGPAAITSGAQRASRALVVVWIVTITAGRLLAYKGTPAIEWMTVIVMIAIVSVAALTIYVVPALRPSRSGA